MPPLYIKTILYMLKFRPIIPYFNINFRSLSNSTCDFNFLLKKKKLFHISSNNICNERKKDKKKYSLQLTCFQSCCISSIQCLIFGLRIVKTQYFINEMKEKQVKPRIFSLSIGSFCSNNMCRTHWITVKDNTKLLSPIAIFGKYSSMPFNTVGQIPMEFKIHLLCLVT